jgi:hypothetical protein
MAKRYPGEFLRDGLTIDERLARLENKVLGTDRVPGLEREHDTTRQRLEELESVERRRRLPWYLRLFFRKAAHADVAPHTPPARRGAAAPTRPSTH